MMLPFCQKNKDDLLRKKYTSVISSDRKVKDDKKYFFHKRVVMILRTFMENFIGVFIHCFAIRKQEA